MKLKDVLSKVRNKANGQLVLNTKKKVLKEIDLSEEDLLNMKIDSKLKRLINI